ncbi:dihydrofolate reductase family protein [Psychromicrobium lacuslunae]|uniref:Bacterial bifunctional deaminase-reductase C-terminal domain-containing protein n=1 Tax=Psychromicrobium lacuslunae TaxID=1618207 RepID=A0A0D4C0J2_9MICC|nr:dihydrofolate reductase family protein [Psychromicrobium lacuslunae]AJT42192.1 hypothetical protein UM93_13015 [Psychromicrobium lacuslunae]
MRKLIVKMSISLDGYVVGPHGDSEWMFRHRSEDSSAWVLETIQQAGLHAMGSVTYRIMSNFWPSGTDQMAAAMNEIPKVVFTRQESFDAQVPPAVAASAGASSWNASRVANGDLAEEVGRLKQESGGYILVHGGANFVSSLIQHGLVDEYRLAVHPVALGGGLPIFADLAQPLNLALISSTRFDGGVIAQVYRPERE